MGIKQIDHLTLRATAGKRVGQGWSGNKYVQNIEDPEGGQNPNKGGRGTKNVFASIHTSSHTCILMMKKPLKV